ncbi:hypothetical protein HWV62_35270 [Athelia sp. TMB]|nr:hypothetical protein HWV62_35270 [Athelia sp. TMB]
MPSATSLAFSQPPSTPSSQATAQASVSFNSTSGILFTFLVIFLAFFGACMAVGLCAHRLVAGRRRALRRQAEAWAEGVLARGGDGRGKPVLWEAWVGEDGDGDGKVGVEWADVQPLSAQKLTAPNSNPSRPCARPRRPNPYLASGTALPTNRQLAQDALRDLVTRGTLRPAPLPFSPAPSACASRVDLDGDLGAASAVRVAVLVAMPSLRHRRAVQVDEKVEEEGLREYVVGVAEAKVA